MSVWAATNKGCFSILQQIPEPEISFHVHVGPGSGVEGRTEVSTGFVKALIDRRSNDKPKIVAFLQDRLVPQHPSGMSGPRKFHLVTICRSASAQKHEIRLLGQETIMPDCDPTGRRLVEFRAADVPAARHNKLSFSSGEITQRLSVQKFVESVLYGASRLSEQSMDAVAADRPYLYELLQALGRMSREDLGSFLTRFPQESRLFRTEIARWLDQKSIRTDRFASSKVYGVLALLGAFSSIGAFVLLTDEGLRNFLTGSLALGSLGCFWFFHESSHAEKESWWFAERRDLLEYTPSPYAAEDRAPTMFRTF